MKKYTIQILLCLFLVLGLSASCTKKGEDGKEETPGKEDVKPSPEPEIPDEPKEDWSWVDGYPKGVSVTSFDETLQDSKLCHGYVATINFSKNPNLRFNCRNSSKKKKTSGFFADLPAEKGVACLAVNGGYFAGATSVSLVASDGTFKVAAFRAFNWPNDENAVTTIYPVRSAIGQMPDGHFEIQWTYCTDVAHRTHTAFPSPLDNNEKTQTFMSEPPKADYCEGSFTWTPQEAIGGGPRLVKDGQDVSTDSYWGECLDAGGTAAFSRANRTAAGITADGQLILLVADGRGKNGSAGYTLAELSTKLISLGCVSALNLDGGGSSCMVGQAGQVLNAPSDASGERSVASAIVISELPRE